jgi:hypothetical protein
MPSGRDIGPWSSPSGAVALATDRARRCRRSGAVLPPRHDSNTASDDRTCQYRNRTVIAWLFCNSDEDHVEQWIGAIDKWIAWAEARYALSLDEASRQRSIRLDDEARQRERIQQLNERFKNL